MGRSSSGEVLTGCLLSICARYWRKRQTEKDDADCQRVCSSVLTFHQKLSEWFGLNSATRIALVPRLQVTMNRSEDSVQRGNARDGLHRHSRGMPTLTP
jgi:hypothetical protein